MVDWKYGQSLAGREEQGMIDRIELRKTEEGVNGATWYELRIYMSLGRCDRYSIRCSYSGMWTFSSDPDFPMAYDTFSGMMEMIAAMYDQWHEEYILTWAYEQEEDEEDYA